jgi:transcriptional regulator with XRE-family HTH domain
VGAVPTRRRTSLAVQARRALQPLLTSEGQKVRRARYRRRWTQPDLARRTGVSASTISALERGDGATLSLELWQQVCLALELPMRLEIGRDRMEEPVDAGHLRIQELVLRLGRATGRRRTFELATKPDDPSRSTDVGLVDDVARRLVLVECVNTFGNVNASIRSSDRKRAEANALAVSIGHVDLYLVRTCWVVRATKRNRTLLATYPELFATRFPGSSRGWVNALTHGTSPPDEPGLVWCDVNATRLFEWRPRARDEDRD